MKKILIITCLVVFGTMCFAQSKMFQSPSIGVAGAYTSHQKFSPEVFFQMRLVVAQHPCEVKFGVNYQVFDAKLQNIDQLETKSIGLFSEAMIFPFPKGFFTGFRWNLIDFNRFTDAALKKIEPISVKSFTGTRFYVIAGIDIPLASKANLRIYAMPGLLQYQLPEGNFHASKNLSQRYYHQFVHQLNFALSFHIK